MKRLEPGEDAVARLSAGADPALLAEAARVTTPSDQEVAALVAGLRRERVPARRGWPIWIGAVLLGGGLAFAAMRVADSPMGTHGEPARAVAPAEGPAREVPTVAPVESPVPPGEAGEALPLEAPLSREAITRPTPRVVPDPVVGLDPASSPGPMEAAPVEGALADPASVAAPASPPSSEPPVTEEPRAFARLLAREEAGDPPAKLLADVESFAAGARSAHLRAEAELLALELRARVGRAPGELATRAAAWARAHADHPRVGTAWLLAGDAAMKARDCPAAQEAWAAAAASAEREAAERASGRRCR
jgi:hypothetical protein